MNADFSHLLEFLERCGPEVNGHGVNDLNADRRALIERFIAGHCDATERRELSEFLQLHPAWIRWIADRVEMSREMDPSSPVESSPGKQISA